MFECLELRRLDCCLWHKYTTNLSETVCSFTVNGVFFRNSTHPGVTFSCNSSCWFYEISPEFYRDSLWNHFKVSCKIYSDSFEIHSSLQSLFPICRKNLSGEAKRPNSASAQVAQDISFLLGYFLGTVKCYGVMAWMRFSHLSMQMMSFTKNRFFFFVKRLGSNGKRSIFWRGGELRD